MNPHHHLQQRYQQRRNQRDLAPALAATPIKSSEFDDDARAIYGNVPNTVTCQAIVEVKFTDDVPSALVKYGRNSSQSSADR